MLAFLLKSYLMQHNIMNLCTSFRFFQQLFMNKKLHELVIQQDQEMSLSKATWTFLYEISEQILKCQNPLFGKHLIDKQYFSKRNTICLISVIPPFSIASLETGGTYQFSILLQEKQNHVSLTLLKIVLYLFLLTRSRKL